MKPDTSRIVVERRLPASIERVFAAWSDPEQLALWMRPSLDMQPAEVELDFRVGGGFRIVMHGERAFGHRGEYLEIDPPRRLVFTWISEFAPPGEQQTRVAVTLESLGLDCTRCLLVHEQLPASDTYAGHAAGWARILSLAAQSLGSASAGAPLGAKGRQP